MARAGKIAKNERRKVVVARFAARRAELKDVLRRPDATPQEKADARRELDRQPRDASATRVRNRDSLDGRARGHLRRFGLSRINLRAQAHTGHLPGVRKASW
ncbi:30S ribosomal protein S14 [Streptomyces sp. NPDC005722]